MLVRFLSSVVTMVAVAIRHAIEGDAPLREVRDAPPVDCPDHGRTFLQQTRLTACCASRSWIHSGYVKSRALGGIAAEVIFN